MDAAPAATQLHGMAQMQHLVKHEVLHCILGDRGTVKDPADHNGVVCGIVVSQALAGMITAPGHLRPRHQAVKEPLVEIVKDFFQMIVFAAWRIHLLAASHLPDQV